MPGKVERKGSELVSLPGGVRIELLLQTRREGKKDTIPSSGKKKKTLGDPCLIQASGHIGGSGIPIGDWEDGGIYAQVWFRQKSQGSVGVDYLRGL